MGGNEKGNRMRMLHRIIGVLGSLFGTLIGALAGGVFLLLTLLLSASPYIVAGLVIY
jgi:hypothetical protein